MNDRKTPKTCLTNHKGYISHHITPLVINSLRGGHTHTSIQTSRTKQFQETNRAPAKGRSATGLKINECILCLFCETLHL